MIRRPKDEQSDAEVFVDILLEVLDIPEVQAAVAQAVSGHLLSMRIPTIPATDHPAPRPPPTRLSVSGRGQRTTKPR